MSKSASHWKRKRQYWVRERPRIARLKAIIAMLAHGARYYRVEIEGKHLRVEGSQDRQTWLSLPCTSFSYQYTSFIFGPTTIKLQLDGREWHRTSDSVVLTVGWNMGVDEARPNSEYSMASSVPATPLEHAMGMAMGDSVPIAGDEGSFHHEWTVPIIIGDVLEPTDAAAPMPGLDSDHSDEEAWEQGIHEMIAKMRQRQEDGHA